MPTLLLALFLAGMAAPAGATEARTERLQIVTGSGPHAFEVELVRSGADMERGLMYRRTMAAGHGMLFDFRTMRVISMWMKNTYLPLDMVFIGADGHVVHVAENAEPFSEAIISSQAPALGVLEVNAGMAAKIGIKDGDVVHASIFPK